MGVNPQHELRRKLADRIARELRENRYLAAGALTQKVAEKIDGLLPGDGDVNDPKLPAICFGPWATGDKTCVLQVTVECNVRAEVIAFKLTSVGSGVAGATAAYKLGLNNMPGMPGK